MIVFAEKYEAPVVALLQNSSCNLLTTIQLKNAARFNVESSTPSVKSIQDLKGPISKVQKPELKLG